ncbi:hypothetical protein LAD12857_17290 [Lacrimispora amygdalina]|uniref:Uncharacterized protein n=1 Tax=Lacrimispora amygdalina TaxID=253257 RepID=A0ABQ5M5J7_9FIRM
MKKYLKKYLSYSKNLLKKIIKYTYHMSNVKSKLNMNYEVNKSIFIYVYTLECEMLWIESALPSAVNRQERRKVHLPLTSTILIIMVHPCFSAGNERKYSATIF